MSVSSLAKEADMSVGTIYQYVKNKDDILVLLISDVLDSYNQSVPDAMAGIADPVQRLAAGFTAYCRVVDSHRAATMLAYRESHTLTRDSLRRIKRMEEQTTGLLAECVHAGAEAGLLRESPLLELVAWNLVMVAHMWALKHWHFHGMTIDDYARDQLRCLLGSVLADGAEASHPALFAADHVTS